MVEVSLSYISHGPSGQWGNPSWSQEVIQSTNPNCQDMGNEVGANSVPVSWGVGMDGLGWIGAKLIFGFFGWMGWMGFFWVGVV